MRFSLKNLLNIRNNEILQITRLPWLVNLSTCINAPKDLFRMEERNVKKKYSFTL